MTRMKTLAAAAFLATAASSSMVGAAAAGVGVSWGDGTLHYKGKDYPFRLKGLTVVDVGASASRARERCTTSNASRTSTATTRRCRRARRSPAGRR